MNEQQLRHVIRQVIRETADPTLLREENRLYTAFVTPFLDVAKAVKLTSQDVLNTFKLVFKTLTTISPEKLVDAREDYLETRKSLESEWRPILESAKTAIENSDFGIAAFAMAPNLFFGYQLGKFAKNVPGNIVDYFDEAGWNVPLKKFLGSTPDEDKIRSMFDDMFSSDGDDSRSSTRSSRGKETRGISDRLRIFFFGESVFNSSDKLIIEDNSLERGSKSENDEQKSTLAKRLTSKNIDNQLTMYFKATGMDKSLNELAEKILEAKRNHAESLRSIAGQQINALKSFSNAKTIEEFDTAVKESAKSGADVAAIQEKLVKLKKDLEKKVADLKQDDKFKKEMKRKAKGKEVSDEDIDAAAQKSAKEVADKAIEDLKKEIASSLQNAMSEMKKQIIKELSDGLPDQSDPLYTRIMSTPMGKRLQAILNDATAGLGS